MSTRYRNTLFLIADDWSPLAGCYGNTVIRTPNIDALAERGVVFDHAFCTSPSCAVSRACILTGQHSHTHGQYGHCHGIHGFRTHERMPSTPRILKQHGFATACVGKKHVEPAVVYPFDYEPRVNCRSVHDMADCAREFLSGLAGQNFYLHVGFCDPHRSPQGFGNESEYRDVEEVTYSPDEVTVPNFLPDVPAVRAELADYYQAITRYDTGIGLVLEALEQSGRAEDTLVIVTTDHGMPFPGGKASGFDSGHLCPFIIFSPDQKRRGLRNRAMINWTNICPTVLEWCGVEPPAELPERSFLPILEESEPEGWDETYFSHCFHEVTNYYPYRTLRGRRYKFVRNLAHELSTPLPSDLFRSLTWAAVRRDNLAQMGDRPTERFVHQDAEQLFDIVEDPAESRNLIAEPALREVADEMRRKLMDFRIRTQDPWLEQSWQEGEPLTIPPGSPRDGRTAEEYHRGRLAERGF